MRACSSATVCSFFRRLRSSSSAICTASNKSCSRKGFVKNSTAPAFIALTDMGVGMSSDKDDGNVNVCGTELRLKVKPAESLQSHVQDKALRYVVVQAC